MFQMRQLLIVPLAGLVLLGGCALTRSASTPAPKTPFGSTPEPDAVDLGGLMIRMERDGVIGLDSYDGDQLFTLGLEAYSEEEYTVSLYVFDHLLQVFPEHSDRVPATWNMALSAEKLGRISEAIEGFTGYLDLVASTDGEEAAQARLRLGTLLQRESRYVEVLEVLDAPSAFVAYADYEVWELRALRAIAKGAMGSFDWAENELNRVRMEVKRTTRKTGERFPYQAAMVWYLAGELDRLQARAVLLDSVDDLDLLDQKIGEKADLLITARSRLKRAIEHGEPSWSGPAALALGAVYRDFRDDMLAAPSPTDLDAEQFVVYERLVRERTEEFLQAAIKDYRAILAAAAGWQLEAPWIAAIEDALTGCESELEQDRSATAE